MKNLYNFQRSNVIEQFWSSDFLLVPNKYLPGPFAHIDWNVFWADGILIDRLCE